VIEALVGDAGGCLLHPRDYRIGETDMADYDRPTETTVVHTDGGNGGLYAVLIVVVILLVAGFVWFSGGFGGRDADNGPDIELNVPQPSAPDVDVDVKTPDVDVKPDGK
jgi:hypothetical protein